MKSTFFAAVAALAAQNVAAHSMFQQLWVDGVDMGSQCVRMPPNNNPVTNVGSNDVRCNVGGTRGVAGKCPVKAGGTVTVEMHAQPNDRNCKNEAIGGAHYGPVLVYMTKVEDAAKADGSTGWFKIFQDTWTAKSGAYAGDADNWGTNDLNSCCGRMDVKVPADLPDGDYLLRAEVVALHVAGSSGGAQLYMSCYQISVTGGGSKLPSSTVKFPGAYKASDPGILINIHSTVSSYVAPGPAVVDGGATKVAGSGCGSGCEKTCTVGKGEAGKVITANPGGGSTDAGSGSAGAGSSNCAQAQFQQCGGQGYTGCTSCAAGLTCKDVSPPYYSQCA